MKVKKIPVCWDITPYNISLIFRVKMLAKKQEARISSCFLLASYLTYSWILKMEAI
jgi:hypothetical protein